MYTSIRTVETFLILSFFTIAAIDFALCNHDHTVVCTQREKQALLSFKHHLKDPSNWLSSWRGEDDCCKWEGVVCDNLTGHVLALHLSKPSFSDNSSFSYNSSFSDNSLGGEISPSLLNLKHLNHLDLSGNDFSGIPIPSFIGSLVSLQYLNFSQAGFGGTIPNQLGNLSSLRILSLQYGGIDGMGVENLQWLLGLSGLEHLDLSGVNLTTAPNWLQVINKLPSLVELYLSNCLLDHIPQEPVGVNFTSDLAILDLSRNSFDSLIPSWIFSLGSLTSLSLRDNGFHGPLPIVVPNMTSGRLKYLDLSFNNLNCTIPGWLYSFSRLEILHLSSNALEGGISDEIGNLTSVTSLFLSANNLEGKLPDTIGKLTSINILDLSWNKLEGRLPDSIGNLTSVTSLFLSDNNLEGKLPDTIGKLTSINILDLLWNKLEGRLPDSIGNLISLNTLHLSGNKLEGRLPDSIGNLISLKTLHLSGNNFDGRLPRSLGNLCNLSFLGMSFNNFSGELFTSSSKCSTYALESLRLQGNQLSGRLPDQIGQFQNMRKIDLGNNFLSGPIPVTLGRLTSMTSLKLGENQLNGTLPESIGHLSKLYELDLTNNLLEGIVSEVHFANLTSLYDLSASGNRLTLKVSADWIPPFQLGYVKLGSWHLGPNFPMWLQTQKHLEELNVSSTGISSKIPTWFWHITSKATPRDLSHNQINGEIPYIEAFYPFSAMFLNSNKFSGPLPLFSSKLLQIDLSDNSFSGDISHFLCEWKESPGVNVLHLGGNFLSGKIPNCWTGWEALVVIEMENNNLTGNIPSSMGLLSSLQSLHLRNNHLSGGIPSALQNCTSLEVVDLSENEFVGRIPKWMGERLSSLKILSLRSNKFEGAIPLELCRLSSLQVLDLAHNNLSGAIPRCINNFTSMAVKLNLSDPIYFGAGPSRSMEVYIQKAHLVTKGNMYQYDKILGLVALLDLSNNNISGNIPEELTSLLGLISLNLSENHLRGVIPSRIGNILGLGSLDLSKNQLNGEIPQSMSGMFFLSYLNLSYNHLSGKIPLSTQLQNFDTSSFIGNKLCGLPLTKNCSTVGGSSTLGEGKRNEGNGKEVDWLYLCMAIGFAVGFWCVSISILFIKSWRYAYFRFLENVWTWLVVLYRRKRKCV